GMQLEGPASISVVQGTILHLIFAANWFILPAMIFRMALELGEKLSYPEKLEPYCSKYCAPVLRISNHPLISRSRGFIITSSETKRLT
ncbi:MAG TPA: hypothetical protein DEP43_07265, partial [Ruminococcaceae bacterium]|nr:hypothetical protein [Oscillospiraceae bacterium]